MLTGDGRDPIAGWSFDDDFFQVLPGGGLSYALGDHAAVFANYFEGFRAPQVWGFGSTTGNGSLELELGRSIEVGVRTQNLSGITSPAALIEAFEQSVNLKNIADVQLESIEVSEDGMHATAKLIQTKNGNGKVISSPQWHYFDNDWWQIDD